MLAAQDLMFHQCPTIIMKNPSRCQNWSKTQGHYCRSRKFQIQALPSYVNDFEQIKGSMKVTISSSAHDISHDFLGNLLRDIDDKTVRR